MNENQKIILEELKKYDGASLTEPIWALLEHYMNGEMQTSVLKAFESLTRAEESEVLVEYEKWGLKKYEDDGTATLPILPWFS